MQIIINQGGNLSEGQTRLIHNKMEKLTTFYERIERADVHFRTDDGYTEGDVLTVSVRLAIPGADVAAEHTDTSLERAVAEVQEKLRRQLRRTKEKQNSHKL